MLQLASLFIAKYIARSTCHLLHVIWYVLSPLFFVDFVVSSFNSTEQHKNDEWAPYRSATELASFISEWSNQWSWVLQWLPKQAACMLILFVFVLIIHCHYSPPWSRPNFGELARWRYFWLYILQWKVKPVVTSVCLVCAASNLSDICKCWKYLNFMC